MAKNCTICGKPVELSPSATERARRYGGTPAVYESLFPRHADCEIETRRAGVAELIAKRIQQQQAWPGAATLFLADETPDNRLVSHFPEYLRDKFARLKPIHNKTT